MKKNYYKLFADCYCKGATCLHPNSSIDEKRCHDGDGKSISYLEGFRFVFPKDNNDDEFLPILNSLGIDCNIVSQQFKDIVEPYITDSTSIEFVPVKVYSEKYGERPYYIMHFLKFENVIDYESSKIITYADGTKTVMVPHLKLNLIKNLHLFCVNAVGHIIISDILKKALIRKGLKYGLAFSKSYICE